MTAVDPRHARQARIAVLGAGPAAVASAILLARLGHEVVVIGTPRTQPAAEGVSDRTIEGLRRLGCERALALLDTRFERCASWAGHSAPANGECVVERLQLDAALWGDLAAARVPLQRARAGTPRRQLGGGWRIPWRANEAMGEIEAGFIIDARGSAAPRGGPDTARGLAMVALTRRYRGAPRNAPATRVASFADGWAWAARFADGQAAVQVMWDGARPGRPDGWSPSIHHGLAIAQVSELGELLADAVPIAAADVLRAARERLRGALAGSDWLRVGEAAASCDPLSGHGLHEALSGAFLAAPVVNTLLSTPQHREMARDHYAQRIGLRYAANAERAAALYRREARWPEAGFWRRRHATPSTAPAVTRAAFVDDTVVEDGRIVRRTVLVCPEHPQGVRFVGRVDLARLHRLLGSGVNRSEALAEALAAAPAQVAAARHLLARLGLQP